jgi:hypothetical protein
MHDAEAMLTVVVLTVIGIVAYVALRRPRELLMEQVVESRNCSDTVPEAAGEVESQSHHQATP